MKLICDCGVELNFRIKDEKDKDEFDAVYAKTEGRMTLAGEHDVVWISCDKCKKSIYIYT
jgi:hypothetical protein